MHRVRKKVPLSFCLFVKQMLTDFQNSFTADFPVNFW